MDENKIRQIVQQELQRSNNASRFAVNSIPQHTHDGISSPKIKAENVIPSTSISGRITFAQITDYTLKLNSNFTPSHISLYGMAYSTSGSYTFTSSTQVSALAGDVYSQGSTIYTVVSTVVNSYTIAMTGSSEPSTSGSLGRLLGSGTTPINYVSYSSSVSSDIRCMIVGSANLGPSFYFQPDSATSVQPGNIQYPFINPNIDGAVNVPLQSSMYLWVDNGSTTFRGQPGEGHIVDVQSAGTIYARMTVVDFNRDAIKLNVSYLSSGWEIYTNIVVT
jgi:hypothetical protein